MAATYENRVASHRLEAGSSAAALVGSPAGTNLGNACAGMTPEDLEQLRWVAEVLGADRSMAMRVGSFVSDQAEGFVDAAGRFIMNNSRFSARNGCSEATRKPRAVLSDAVGDKDIADTANGLEEKRQFGIFLDLAPEPRDLHIVVYVIRFRAVGA